MKRILTSLFALGLASCAQDAPETVDMFNQVTLHLVGGSDGLAADDFHARLAAAIDGATQRVDLAAERFEAPVVSDALARAVARGVTVRVVGDEDMRGDSGFATVAAAGATVVFGNGAIPWSPQPGVEMTRSGDHNLMTHNFVVIDETVVWTWTGGLLPSTEAGLQSVLEMRSQDLAKDFGAMHQQMVGGTFATTLTVYGAMTSATNDTRYRYMLADPWTMELQFAPAEPAIKTIIDNVYAARASVWISASYLWNRPLADALRYKAEAGFDVRVIIDSESLASPYDQADRLGRLFDTMREGDAEYPRLYTVDRTLDTFVLIDGARSPIDHDVYPRLALWASHGALPATPYTNSDSGPASRPAGTFTDGAMWGFREEPGIAAQPLNALVARFNRLLMEVPQ